MLQGESTCTCTAPPLLVVVVRLARLDARQHGLVLVVDALELSHAVIAVQALVLVVVARVQARVLARGVVSAESIRTGYTMSTDRQNTLGRG
jgi:hypothetical protein